MSAQAAAQVPHLDYSLLMASLPLISAMLKARKQWLVFLTLLIAAATFRIFVAHHWPNDAPDDSKTYARIARNLLEQHSFSDSEASTPPPAG